MIKTDNFSTRLQETAHIAKALSHPARLMILEYLAEQKVCISGDITKEIPLSRTTVSQHLKELKNAGLIKGSIQGLHINYCLQTERIRDIKQALISFFDNIDTGAPLQC